MGVGGAVGAVCIIHSHDPLPWLLPSTAGEGATNITNGEPFSHGRTLWKHIVIA